MATQTGPVHVGATQRPSWVHPHTQNCSRTDAAPCKYGPGENLDLSFRSGNTGCPNAASILGQNEISPEESGSAGGRKLPAWIPPQFPNAQFLIGPPLSLHYHSLQGSAVCCPMRTEVIWAQPSQSPQPGLYPHILKLPMEAETVFSWESTTFFFSFELVLTILKSVGFMNGIMN